MLTLGLCGGLDSVHEPAFDTPSNYTYDGAAVLLENGSVLAAFEEERLNRIKHSNKLAVQAIARCLCTRDVDLTDVDLIALHVDEKSANEQLSRFRLA
jgi:carbamoyltransferase